MLEVRSEPSNPYVPLILHRAQLTALQLFLHRDVTAPSRTRPQAAVEEGPLPTERGCRDRPCSPLNDLPGNSRYRPTTRHGSAHDRL
jgi:hypothetical protein